MEPPKEPPLEEQVRRIRSDVQSIARKLKIPYGEVLQLLTHREIVILNSQLRTIHEMLDLLYAEKAKVKERR